MDSFKMDQFIALGSYGKVYSGTYQGQEVAIKKIDLDRLHLDGNVDRECQVLGQLDHPNVLKLLHWKDEGEFRYLVLELCTGTLGEYLIGKYKGPMPGDLEALHQMAAGVQHIHSRKLVHRDIKPENVLISKPMDSRVHLKISDFGLSKCTTDSGRFSLGSGIKGTPSYLTPELLEAVNQDKPDGGTTKSDVFALGCVFYKFLTRGSHPFGEDAFILYRIVRGESNLQKLSKDHAAYSLIEKMILREPDSRPSIYAITEILKAVKLLGNIKCAPILCYEQEQFAQVNQCRFCPSEVKLACALDHGKICIFSSSSHSIPFSEWERIDLQASTDESVLCVDWNADGCRLAAGCANGTAISWEQNGQMLVAKKHLNSIRCIRWNRSIENGHLVLTGGDKTVILWDFNKFTALKTFQFHGNWINDLEWVSANEFATCSDDKTIKICRIDSASPVHTLQHKDCVYSLRWIRESERLVTCSKDGSVKIWCFSRSDSVLELRGDGFGIQCIDLHRISTDGKERWWIAGGCDTFLFIWDVGESVAPTSQRGLKGHSYAITSVAFSPDGESLSSADERGSVIIWNTQSGETIYRTEIRAVIGIDNLIWDPSGTKLIVANKSCKVFIMEFGS